MTDDLRDRIAEALTREHNRRARERIAASPEEHCAAFADVAMAVVQPELSRAEAAEAARDRHARDRDVARTELDYWRQRAEQAEAAIERVRRLCGQWQAVMRSDESHPATAIVLAALDQLREQT